MNRWGSVQHRYPADTLILKYEDFRRDTAGELDRLARHLGAVLPPEAIEKGVVAGRKENMLEFQNPNATGKGVRPDGAGDTVWTPEADAVFKPILREHLKYDLGYDFGL